MTLHAVIADCLAQQWATYGCDRERHNRLADQRSRRIERRLNALAAEGITVVRASSADDMHVEGAPVEILQFDDARGLQIRICSAAAPDQLLRGLDAAEDVLDGAVALGSWTASAEGHWRGLALRP